jgi:transcriptional regulator with XRE-family HTH domain
MARSKVGQRTVDAVGSLSNQLGDYLKEQRTQSRLSLRQLAEQVGVSNPYLSQIERGLRRPSAEVLQQLAKALRISAEQLYIRAGIVSPDSVVGGVGGSVELAVLDDAGLTERQKQTLLDVYASFIHQNDDLQSD